ncbi:MAG: hypothetical protein U5J95_03865 [Balneolaceae bacterium]|nr:hypothetical protein [Balneolaceae bacterium]
MGQDIEEVANATVEIFGPGWSNDLTPLQMVKNLHRNWMASQKAEFEVLEASEDIIRVRMNRPYLDFFGENW